MRYRLKAEFFCSYFFEPALIQSKLARSYVQRGSMLEAVHSSVGAVILLQTVLESYINVVIDSCGLGEVEVTVRSRRGPESKPLSTVSIRDKWRKVPGLLGLGDFDESKAPFSEFLTLVDIRNKLVHFRPTDLVGEVEVLGGAEVVEQLRAVFSEPGVFRSAGPLSFLGEIVAAGIGGPSTVRQLVEALQRSSKVPRARFLTSEELLAVEPVH